MLFFGGDNNLNLIIDHFYLCGTRYEKWKKWWENIINLFRARTQYSWKQLDFRETKRISVFFICFYINLLMLIKPFELIFFCVFTQLKTQTTCIHAFHTLVAEAVFYNTFPTSRPLTNTAYTYALLLNPSPPKTAISSSWE